MKSKEFLLIIIALAVVRLVSLLLLWGIFLFPDVLFPDWFLKSSTYILVAFIVGGTWLLYSNGTFQHGKHTKFTLAFAGAFYLLGWYMIFFERADFRFAVWIGVLWILTLYTIHFFQKKHISNFDTLKMLTITSYGLGDVLALHGIAIVGNIAQWVFLAAVGVQIYLSWKGTVPPQFPTISEDGNAVFHDSIE